MGLSREKRTVFILAACQALFWSGLMIGITMSGLVGQMLVEQKSLATLPAGLLALTVMLVTKPASRFMQRRGRRAGFMLGALAGVAGGAVSALAIFLGDFILFCAGNAILGLYQAIGQYYRLAATDAVAPERHGWAISTVMAGGVLAALVAPSLSIWSKDLFAPVLFAGSFMAVTALGVAAMILVTTLAPGKPASSAAASSDKPIGEILRRPAFIAAIVNAGVAQGVMILIMLATPLAMVACDHPVSDAAWVIQWHVLGMFVPSFFSGRLVDRFGAGAIASAGAVILAGSALVASTGLDLWNFSVALGLLGVGWNFMYVAGSTMIAASHAPEERGQVQGVAEMSIAAIGAVASFGSAGLLHGLGWSAVNIAALPMLAIAVLLTLWAARHGAAAAEG
jgi:predicted MFS family arabinose efflux permease